jgi:hypothetical protein
MLKRTFIALSLALLAAGCAHVEPWQKAELSQAYMAPRSNEWGAAFRTHAIITVEQAEGGDSLAGGGCGCR